MFHLQRLSMVVLILMLLPACDPFSQPDNMMDTYIERLGNVLDVASVSSPLITVQTLPRMRDRRIEIEQIRINMLDFLSLYGCELQVVVGERNSAMGRVMTPLNDLRYQLRFIDKADQCLPKIEQQALKTQLAQAIAHKKDTLSHYFWNAVWADEPMAELMSQSSGFYRGTEAHISADKLNADLKHAKAVLEALKSGTVAPQLTKMGEIQQRWVFDHSAGQLINSARLLITRLNDASDMLEQKINGRPLCYLNKPNPQAERVKGLFFNVYIARVQPYISEVSRAAEQIFRGLSALVELQQNEMPASFQSYYRQVLDTSRKGSLWQQFDEAVTHHTKSWQKLLRQCGMQPMAG